MRRKSSFQEVWKKIPEVPKYEVSNYGKVKNKKTGALLKPSYHKEKACYIIGIRYNKKNYVYTLHRLVAKLFLPNPDNCKYVAHINKDKLDNRVENLEWRESIDRLRQNSSISNEEELVIMEKLRMGITGAEIALEYNTSEMSISRINKKMMRIMDKDIQKKGKRLLKPVKSNKKVKNIDQLDWVNFIQTSLKEENIILSSSDFINLAIQKYGFTNLNRLNVSNQLATILTKLLNLGLLKRVTKPSKQRFYYGLYIWYNEKGELMPQHNGTFDNSIEKRMERSSGTKKDVYREFIFNTLMLEKKVLSLDEFLKKAEDTNIFKGKNKFLFKKNLQNILEQMVGYTILNKQQADENEFWYGLDNWWFRNNGKLKSSFTGL